MKSLANVLLFFGLLVFLMALVKGSVFEGFRGGGGEGIGGRTAGPAATSLEDEEEAFRGGGGQAIGGRTAGPAATALGDEEEAFVSGSSSTPMGPAPASLNEPRAPYHLLSDVIPNAPRDTIGCLRAGCCNETDFEARTNQTGNYLQRTNNYKRAYPDNCTAPLHEFTMSFYKTTPL